MCVCVCVSVCTIDVGLGCECQPCQTADLWAFGPLPPQPAVNAGVAKQVAAAQGSKAVIARRGPGLKTDGAGLPLPLLIFGLSWGTRQGSRRQSRGWNTLKIRVPISVHLPTNTAFSTARVLQRYLTAFKA